MPTHYTVSGKKSPDYCDEPRFDSLLEARTWRAKQKNAANLKVFIVQDADRWHGIFVKVLPDSLPDDWDHWNWNGLIPTKRNRFKRTLVYIAWDDTEVLYVDGELASIGERPMIGEGPANIKASQWLNAMAHLPRAGRHGRSIYTHVPWVNAPARIPWTLEELEKTGFDWQKQ